MNPLNRKKTEGSRIRKTSAVAGIAAALVFSTIPFGGPNRTFAEQSEGALQLEAAVHDMDTHYSLDLHLTGNADEQEGSAQAVAFYSPFLSEKWSATGAVNTAIRPSAVTISQLPALKEGLDPIAEKAREITGKLTAKLSEEVVSEDPETGETETVTVSDLIAIAGLPEVETAAASLADPSGLASLPVYEKEIPVSAYGEAFLADFSEGLDQHLETKIESVVWDSVEGVRANVEALELIMKEQSEAADAPQSETGQLIDEINAEIIEPGKEQLETLIEQAHAAIQGEDSEWTGVLDELRKVDSIEAGTTMRVEKPVGADNPVTIQAGLTSTSPGQDELAFLEAKAEADFGEKGDPVKLPKGPANIYLFAGEPFAFGEGLAGATVFARTQSGKDHLGSAVVEPPIFYFADEIEIENNGFFGMELQRPLIQGEVIEFYQRTEDGQTSESVFVEVLPAPGDDEWEPTLEMPVVDDIYDIDYVITGTADPGNLVAAVDLGMEEVIGFADVEEDGSFWMELEEPLEAGTEVGFIQVNEEEYSDLAIKTVLKAEMSLDPPTVDPLDDDDLSITGAAGAGNVVLAGIGEELIGIAEVEEDGRFDIELAEPLEAGTVVELYQLSEDGQYSDTVSVTVQKAGDAVVQKPTVNAITDKDRAVTGKGLPGHTVIGYSDNEEIGKAEVGKDGTFSIGLENPFSAGTVLEFRQADEDGKLSEPVQVTVGKAESGTGSDSKGNSESESGSKGTNGSSSGQKLPKTATATGAMGLAGGGVLLAGLLMRRFARKARNSQ
ncbi:Ig-like domain-containing protein [Bhargavaea beijingensis]|uniref:Ig-like domain-containing protein n=1 Tax=Bhargavaea beijingensis TaxID=426756 RepID=UPI00222404C0|nr:Ig-like domain-containing protein [Bhargavaea beijingensis]MCW1929589.1 Ig-like domain-containing protein [Bhargavaea beijingensis]